MDGLVASENGSSLQLNGVAVTIGSHGSSDATTNLIVGDGTGVGDDNTPDTSLSLGETADKALALNTLTVHADATVSGTTGQSMSVTSGSIDGALEGDWTLEVREGTEGSALTLNSVALGEVSFLVSGGLLDMNSLVGTNSTTITSGSLANAEAWTGAVAVDTSAGAETISLGGLTASALKNVDLSTGSVVHTIGEGAVVLDSAVIELSVANTIFNDNVNGATSGDGVTILNFATAGDGNTIGLAEGSELVLTADEALSDYFLDNLKIVYDDSELLPDYVDPAESANTISLTLTNGTLDLAASQVRFDPLLKTWGLKLEGIEGGSVVVSGNLSVWRASVEGNIDAYNDLDAYRAVYVDRDMTISLPASNTEELVVNYLSGTDSGDLTLERVGEEGEVRIDFFNGSDKDGELVNSVLKGSLSAGAGVIVSKSGEARLTVGGDLNVSDSLTVEDGSLALSGRRGEHVLGSLAVGDGEGEANTAGFILTGNGSTLQITNLSVKTDGYLELTGVETTTTVGAISELGGSRRQRDRTEPCRWEQARRRWP